MGEMQGLSGAPAVGCWMLTPGAFSESDAEICFHGFFASDYKDLLPVALIVRDFLRRAQYASLYLGPTNAATRTALCDTNLV
jgi:hypothetical protein